MKILTLPSILRNRLIRIPAYQRGYAWENDQVEDFWLDVKALEKDRPHFTGTLTTTGVPDANAADWIYELPDEAAFAGRKLRIGSDAFEILYLVDGQQRLITATILLLVLGARFPGDTELRELVEPLPGVFRLGYEIDMPSHRFLLSEIYQDKPSDEARTAYTANLENAKEFFEREVARLSEGYAREVRHKLLTGVVFVQNHLPPELNASVVFERMNNRGKPLSELELLKNRLLYLIQCLGPEAGTPSDLDRRVNQDWLTIYEWLGKNQNGILDDADFLRNHWILYFPHDADTGSEIRTSTFARDLLQSRFSEKRKRADPQERLTEIIRYSSSLSEATKPWFSQNWPDHAAADLPAEHRLWLNKINSIRRDTFFRPIMNLLLIRDYPEQLVTECLRAIERHEFVLAALIGGRATANRPHFWRRANQLFRSDNPPEGLPAEIDRQADQFYTQAKLYKNMGRVWISKDGLKGGWRAWRYLQHFLREYEAHLCAREDAPAGATTSFVYPGRLRIGDWCDGSFDGLSDLRDDAITTSLGNQILVAHRDRTLAARAPLGRAQAVKADPDAPSPGSFEWKRERRERDGRLDGYLHGSASEREVGQHQIWDHAAVYQRSMKMLSFLSERWAIPLGEAKRRALTRLQFNGVGGT